MLCPLLWILPDLVHEQYWDIFSMVSENPQAQTLKLEVFLEYVTGFIGRIRAGTSFGSLV